MSNPSQLFKRLFDLTLIILSLPLMMPLLLIVSVLVRFTIGSPIFFIQDRAGLNGQAFKIIKFRTLTNAKDQNGHLLPDSERLTPMGHWLRRTSLDELPELLNVWRGEMSLIGPRPLLIAYLPRYTQRQMARHRVRPGITGWAQINGRNQTPWPDRFEMDNWYIENWSIALDIKILALTLFKVFKQTGISQEGHATMPEFFQDSQSKDT